MNRKGFTLVELLATLVILGLVTTIVSFGVNGGFGEAKKKTEGVFIGTIKDALNIYLDSDARELDFSSKCTSSLTKNHASVNVYYEKITFFDVINSTYKPITWDDLVNPANKDIACYSADYPINVTIYKDDDYVYYYSVNKDKFECLLDKDGIISNLPEGFVC